MNVAAVLWLTKVVGEAAAISKLWSPQQHVGREYQGHQTVNRIKQDRIAREQNEQIAVAPRRPDEEAAHEGGYEEQKVPNGSRRNLRAARNPGRDIESKKAVRALPTRIVELVDQMRRHLHDRHERVGKTEREKDEQYATLPERSTAVPHRTAC